MTSTLILRGRRGTYGTGWRAYDVGSQSFDPMWEEASADAWRTDTYVKNSRRLCVSELCGCLTSLEKPAQLVSWCLPVTVTVSCLP